MSCTQPCDHLQPAIFLEALNRFHLKNVAYLLGDFSFKEKVMTTIYNHLSINGFFQYLNEPDLNNIQQFASGMNHRKFGVVKYFYKFCMKSFLLRKEAMWQLGKVVHLHLTTIRHYMSSWLGA
jgi:hypothetical protein